MDMAALDAMRLELAPGAQLIMPTILAVLMFAVALNVHIDDFKALKTQPWRFAGAASAQILGLPLVTLALIYVLTPPPSIALGMIVVACCPGGNVSNFLTHLAKGDTALSVSLTATSAMGAALLTPVSILFWTSLYGPADILVDSVDVDPIPFVLKTTCLLAIPLATGMAIAHYYSKLASRLRPFFLAGGMTGLAFLVFGGLASNWDLFSATAVGVLGIAILHNAIAFGVGSAAGRLLQFGVARRRAMTFEVGIQNTGLGLVILLGQFEAMGGAALIAGLWGIWHLFSGTLLASAFRGLDMYREAHAAKMAE